MSPFFCCSFCILINEHKFGQILISMLSAPALTIPLEELLSFIKIQKEKIEQQRNDIVSVDLIGEIRKFIRDAFDTKGSWAENFFSVLGNNTASKKYIINSLVRIEKIITTATVYVENNDALILERKAVSRAEILRFVLLSIYDAPTPYPDIQSILVLNGFPLLDKQEAESIKIHLTNNNWLNNESTTGLRLTFVGQQYVEEKIVDKDSSVLRNDPESLQDVYQKIAELEALVTLLQSQHAKGMDELHKELQDLKKQSPNLNKKSWTQLAVGKIMDLLLRKVIDGDSAQTLIQWIKNQYPTLMESGQSLLTNIKIEI